MSRATGTALTIALLPVFSGQCGRQIVIQAVFTISQAHWPVRSMRMACGAAKTFPTLGFPWEICVASTAKGSKLEGNPMRHALRA